MADLEDGLHAEEDLVRDTGRVGAFGVWVVFAVDDDGAVELFAICILKEGFRAVEKDGVLLNERFFALGCCQSVESPASDSRSASTSSLALCNSSIKPL